MRPPGIIQTVKYSYNFLSENRRHFLEVLFPMLPFLYAFEVSTTASRLLQKAEITPPSLFTIFLGISLILGGICQIAFIAAWHRAAITGVSADNKVNFLAIKPREWSFFRGIIKYTLLLFALGAVLGFTSILILKAMPVLGIIYAVAAALIGLYVMINLYLYLPARAVGEIISFREAFQITKGLGLRILFTLILASIPIMLISAIGSGIMGGILGMALGRLDSFGQIFAFSLGLSVLLTFFGMALIAITSTVLSRYYVWAVAERPRP